MANRRSGKRFRGQRAQPEVSDAPRATRDEVRALIVQFAVPQHRPDDFVAVASALVREARRYGITVPAWLAATAGYRRPPPPLTLLRHLPKASGTSSRIVDRADAPSAMIIVGGPAPRRR